QNPSIRERQGQGSQLVQLAVEHPQIALITARVDVTSLDRRANGAAGFVVVLTAHAKLTPPHKRGHLAEIEGDIAAVYLPDAEDADARRIDHRAAKVELEQLHRRGRVLALATFALADRADARAQTGLNGVEQAGFANAGLADEDRQLIR